MKILDKFFKKAAPSNTNRNDQMTVLEEQEMNVIEDENHASLEQPLVPRFAQLTPMEAPSMQRALNQQGKPVFNALINSVELKDFFSKKYFSRGRHNGANFGTTPILRSGKNAIVAEFKECLNHMEGKRRNKITEMKNHSESTKDAFIKFDDAMKLQISLLEEEVQIIEHQLTSCEEYEGWIEGPLRKYEAGFLQGLTYATRYRFN